MDDLVGVFASQRFFRIRTLALFAGIGLAASCTTNSLDSSNDDDDDDHDSSTDETEASQDSSETDDSSTTSEIEDEDDDDDDGDESSGETSSESTDASDSADSSVETETSGEEESSEDEDSSSEDDEVVPECGIPDDPPACTATDIRGKLECVPGLTITAGNEGGFSVLFEQPLDHFHPEKGTFKQRLHIIHGGFDQPTVLSTSGYGLTTSGGEPASLFDTNVVGVEHRFFQSSRPSGTTPWEYLTIKQSAFDFHRIWAALKWIYPKAWINTGGSKGGETSVFYRRFFPCDIEGTAAYVAPIVYGWEDPRFVTFINEVGGDAYADCRKRFADLQIAALEQREDILGRMDESKFTWFGGADSPAKAMEHALLESPHLFWQGGGASRCDSLPDPDSSIDTIYNWASEYIDQWTDGSIDYFFPYYYAVGVELGLPDVVDDHILSLLKFRDSYNPQEYMHDGITVTLDESAMKEVQTWVATEGEHLLFVYGEYDPWTAGEYELGDAKDSFKYIAKGGAHGSRISSLAAADREAATQTLERWLGASRRATPKPIVDDFMPRRWRR
jgi:hypothetical protein